MDWNVTLNMLYRENDYEETDLGLTDEEFNSVSFTASWVAERQPGAEPVASGNEYESEQTGRAFRGGSDKNAFEIFPPCPRPPIPRATGTWTSRTKPSRWGWACSGKSRAARTQADYSYQDTESEYDFSNGGAAGLSAEPLPEDYETEMHHAILEGTWQFRENLAVGYQLPVLELRQ